MKKISLLIALLLIAVATVGQAPLDSVAIYKYVDEQTIPVNKTTFQNDLWGKTITRIHTVFDDLESEWETLAKDNLIYSDDQLNEVITYTPVDNTWTQRWREIYTYPGLGKKRSEFYTIEDDGETLHFIYQTDEASEIFSTAEVTDLDGTLTETFRTVRSELTNGYTLTKYRIAIDGTWKSYYKVDNIIVDGLVVEKIHRSLREGIWVNVVKTAVVYNDRRQAVRADRIYWDQNAWSTKIKSSQFYHYSEIVINPPEIDEQNLIKLIQFENRLYVKSKLDLEFISVYDLNARLIYRNESPQKIDVVLTDLKGEYYIEILSVDKRKKISKVLFK